MTVCPSCGAELSEGARFCTNCGERIEAPADFPQQAASLAEPQLPTLPEVPTLDLASPEAPVPEQPVPETPAYEPPPAPPVMPVQPPIPAEVVSSAAPADERPGKKSKYAPMTSAGMAIQLILMNIPGLGFLLTILWSCGACRKITRRNLARAQLILWIIGIVLVVVSALLVRFLFSDVITQIVEELLPGYTIQWH